MVRILSVCGVCWLLVMGGPASAADDLRAVIERAIKAQGGADVLRQQAAIQVKVSGKNEAAGTGMPFSGVALVQPGGATRIDMQMEVGGSSVEVTAVLDGPRSWVKVLGNVVGLPPEQEKQSAAMAFCARVNSLLPLLEDRGFTLAALPEEKIDGKPAIGVKVSYRGESDISLYFDRENGLLVKQSFRVPVAGVGPAVLQERFFSEYREIRPETPPERALRAAGMDTTDRGLMEFLRSRARGKEQVEKVRGLIAKLGDDAFTVREKATKDLIVVGSAAVPLLREAAKSTDPEVARRASLCLEQIKEDGSGGVLTAAVRLAAVRRPPGSTAVLLDLVSGADESLVREIKAALYAQVQAAGKPEDVLSRALDDRDPARQAVASAVLGKDGGAYLKEPRRRVYVRLPKLPMKTRDIVDGKMQMEMEYAEPECFNRFDPKEFAKP
jgi:hypothetical protein